MQAKTPDPTLARAMKLRSRIIKARSSDALAFIGRAAIRVLAICFALGLGAAGGFAADGVWNYNGSAGNWSATARWLNSIVADGAGAHADFSQAGVAVASARTITLDMNVTLGRLTFGDPSGVERAAWRLVGTNTLTFNNNGSTAVLMLGPGSASNNVQISVPILLADSLDIRADSPTGLDTTVGGPISAATAGLKVITNRGAGFYNVSLNGVISDGVGVVSVMQDSASSNLTLAGNNTYSGGTEIKAGSLSINADARLGAAVGAVAFSGGTLAIASSAVDMVSNRATTLNAPGGAFNLLGGSSVTWQGSITGGGRLLKIGTGTLVLTGSNNYSGGTIVDAGILKGNARSIQGNVVNNAALEFAQDFDGVYAGALSGTGSLTKTGAGALTFMGAGSAFSGTLFVNAGEFFLGGGGASLGGGVVVSNATLGGAGVLGSGVSASGATLRIGLDDPAVTGAQTLSVTGALVLQNTQIEFDLFNDGGVTGSDRLDAGGLVDNGGNSIYIGLFRSGTFNLGANLGALWNTATLYVDGVVYQAGGRRTAELFNDNGNLWIEANAGASLALAWTGLASGNWAATGSNWAGINDGLFVNGDSVTFDDSVASAARREIAIGAGGIVVSDMIVDGAGDYTFTGGGILADNTQAEGALATSGSGKLVKKNAGVLALHNGPSQFMGGVDLHAGVLSLGPGAVLSGGTMAVRADNITLRADGAFTIANAIDLSSHGLTLATAGHDVALTGNIAGAGLVTVTGGGVLTFSGVNSHGGVALDSGTLIARHAAALGSAVAINGAGVTIAFETPGTVSTALNFGSHGVTLSGGSADVTLGGALAGSGAVRKIGGGSITLAGANGGFTGAVAVHEGALYFTEIAALGAGSGAITIATGGTLGLAQPSAVASDITFSRALSGEGVFSVSLGAADKVFRLGAGSAQGFAGTVAMNAGVIKLDATTIAELGSVRLVIGRSSTADIAADGSINSLRFDGGALRIGMADGAPGHLLSVTNLDVVSGTVLANVSAISSDDIVNPPVPPNPGIFDLDMTTGTQLVAAANVTGVGTSLALAQLDGFPMASTATANITQSGVIVAKAGYSYTASVTDSGIYLASGIATLDVLGGQTLIVSNSGAPKSVLLALVAGAGGIDVRADGVITLANADNNFTGATTISAGTLRVTAADALTSSSALQIADGATFDTGGSSQTVNNLSGAGGILLGAGTLTVNSAVETEFSGSISAGSGSRLVKNGVGTLTLGGENRNAALTINEGRVRATSAGALGTGAVTISSDATLAFAGVSGTVRNVLTGAAATVEFLEGSDVHLGGANTLSRVNILDGSRVTAAAAGALGGAAASVSVGAGSALNVAVAGARAGDVTIDGGRLSFGVVGGGAGSLDVTGALNFANGATLAIDGNIPGGIHNVVRSGTVAGDFSFDRFQNGMLIDFARTGDGGIQLTALNQAVEPARDITVILDTIVATRDMLSARVAEALLLPVAARGRRTPANEFWINGMMTKTDYGATSEYLGQSVDVHGVLVGYDRKIRGESGLLGIHGSTASGNSTADNHARSEIDTRSIGVHGTANIAPFYISADLGIGWLKANGRRNEGAGIIKADYEGDFQNLGLETGFVWNAGKGAFLRPFAGIQLVSVRMDERVETGNGAMRVQAFRHNTVQGLLAVRGMQRFTLLNRACAFDLGTGWRFDVSSDHGAADATFLADSTGRRFTLRANGYAQGAAFINAGIRVALWNDVLAGISFGYEGGRGLSRQAVNATLRWLW